MNCPLCLDAVLEPHFHGGIEVDVCGRCRGIWLDRGELDRLLGGAEPPAPRAAGWSPPPPPPGDAPRDDRRDERYDDRRDERYDDRRDARYDDRRDARYDERKPKKPKTKAQRLADLFEDVLDF